MKKMVHARFFAIVGTALAFMSAAQAHAALPVRNVQDLNRKVLCPLAGAFFDIIIVVSIGMALWAAYLYMTSGGDTDKVRSATHTITYAAVGFGIAMLAYSFPYILTSLLPGPGIDGCGAV